MTILVTGLIGSGKSLVCRMLRDRGAAVYDSDSRCKSLYGSVPGLEERIRKETGLSIAGLGAIFTDEAKRTAVQNIVYPVLRDDFIRWRESCGADVVVFESATASASPFFSGLFDKVMLVRAPFGKRLERNPRAAERSPLQSEPESADWIVDNDSTVEELERKISTLGIFD